MKGRDKYGRPTEGVDDVPFRPKSKEKQECLSQLVNMLQQANKREEELKGTVKFWSRKYHSLYQEHMALKYDDQCTDCQKKREITPKGGCIELCRECSKGRQTGLSLQRDLEKKDEQIRYWQDCYETALTGRSEFPHTKLSQSYVDEVMMVPVNEFKQLENY